MEKNSDFLISESLLKMSPHGRHIKAYTTRIYTMQYDCMPTIFAMAYATQSFHGISLFWAYHTSHKDLRSRGGGGYTRDL